MKKCNQVEASNNEEEAGIPLIGTWEKSFLYLVRWTYLYILVNFLLIGFMFCGHIDDVKILKAIVILMLPVFWTGHLLGKYAGYR